jgi:hypothetical protein
MFPAQMAGSASALVMPALNASWSATGRFWSMDGSRWTPPEAIEWPAFSPSRPDRVFSRRLVKIEPSELLGAGPRHG